MKWSLTVLHIIKKMVVNGLWSSFCLIFCSDKKCTSFVDNCNFIHSDVGWSMKEKLNKEWSFSLSHFVWPLPASWYHFDAYHVSWSKPYNSDMFLSHLTRLCALPSINHVSVTHLLNMLLTIFIFSTSHCWIVLH